MCRTWKGIINIFRTSSNLKHALRDSRKSSDYFELINNPSGKTNKVVQPEPYFELEGNCDKIRKYEAKPQFYLYIHAHKHNAW